MLSGETLFWINNRLNMGVQVCLKAAHSDLQPLQSPLCLFRHLLKARIFSYKGFPWTERNEASTFSNSLLLLCSPSLLVPNHLLIGFEHMKHEMDRRTTMVISLKSFTCSALRARGSEARRG